ncbi:MAG: tol-pal system protein YbgF, partial [Thermoanaerobaculia bacterium]
YREGMKRAAVAVLLLTAACGSSSGTKTAPVTTPADPQIANLQASMTELLERLDVMNDRITKLESGGQAPPPVQTSPVQTPPVQPSTAGPARTGGAPVHHSAQIADTYRNGIELYGKARFSEARAAFQQVFDADPSGELADNALFWIGETYYSAGDFNNASRYYKRVSDEYGDQNKAPDAMYKLALTYEKTGDLALARATLQQLMARYPYSAPAAAAKSELNRIRY